MKRNTSSMNKFVPYIFSAASTKETAIIHFLVATQYDVRPVLFSSRHKLLKVDWLKNNAYF